MTEDETEKSDVSFGQAAAALAIAEALAKAICLKFPDLVPGLVSRLDQHALFLEEAVHARPDSEEATTLALQRLQSLTTALWSIERRDPSSPRWKRLLRFRWRF